MDNVEVLILHDAAQDVFVNAVLNPPEPNEAAVAACSQFACNSSRFESADIS